MTNKLKIRHLLEAVLIWVLPLALRPLPFKMRVRAGGILVGGAIRFIPPLRKRIQNNLALIYPQMPRNQKKFLCRRIANNIGERFTETFYNREFHKKVVDLHYSKHAFDEIISAQKAGRPVIIVSGHFGHLEAPRVVLEKLGYPSAAIYKENANPIFEGRHKKNMTSKGAPLFATGPAGMRKMLKFLKNGGMVSVLLDQRVDDGEPIDFLGRPALTSTAMFALANRVNALVVPVYSVFRPAGGGTDIYVEPPIPNREPFLMAKQYNDSLSARVEANPEQWYWLHKRWTRPDIQE